MSLPQKGQAVVEYLLIVIVTLSLIIGLSTKFIKPLSKFMQNYAGSYVECLLQTGDLPAFISGNPNSECSIEKMGERGKFEVGSSTTGSTNSGSSNSANNSSNNNSSGSGNNSSGGNNSSRGSNSPSLSSGSNTGADSGGGGASETSGSIRANRGDKLASIANAGANKNNSGQGGSIPYAMREDYGRSITGYIPVSPEEKKEAEKSIKGQNSIKKENTNGGDQLRSSSFSAAVTKPKDRDPAADTGAGMQFGFGKILRYLIIGALIIALIVMVGTQINSLRKNWGSN